jgi:ATP-dependent DNA ligase
LSARRKRLRKILEGFDYGFLHLSESFADADKLLAECEKRGLEGIVSKRLDAPYRADKCDWITWAQGLQITSDRIWAVGREPTCA